MAFQGNAFQPNGFQAGTSDAAAAADELVGAVQVLEVYQYRPPTSFVRVAQIVTPPVEQLLPPAWKQVGTQTFVEPRSKTRIFFDNQERLRDFLGAVQVVENYGFKPPLTVVRPGWSLPEPTPPAVETFQAWMARAISAQPLAANVNIAQPRQRIEEFFPQAWAGRAATAQPPAFRSALFLVRSVEAFNPIAWRVSLNTAVTLQGSAAIFQVVEPSVEAFYPQGQRISASTAVEARTRAAVHHLVFEPEAAVVAAPPRDWGARVQTSIEAKSWAATFQVVEPAVEAFNPQARQAAARTAVQPASLASIFRGQPAIEEFSPQARQAAVATAVRPASVATTFQPVAEPQVVVAPPRGWGASVRTTLEPRTGATTFQVVGEPVAEQALTLVGAVQVVELYRHVLPASSVRLFSQPPLAEAFYPSAWTARTATAVEARGRSQVHQVVKPPVVEDFFPVARQALVRTTIELRGKTTVFFPPRPPPEIIIAPPMAAWIAGARSDIRLGVDAAIFQVVMAPFVQCLEEVGAGIDAGRATSGIRAGQAGAAIQAGRAASGLRGGRAGGAIRAGRVAGNVRRCT